MTTTNKNIIICAFVLFVTLIAAYANHFNNGFHFDDSHAVVDNVHIRNIKNIPTFFSDPKMFSANPEHWGLRPVVTTTLAIDYWLGGGLNPFWFQLDTFIWYVLLCALLFFMYQKILNESITHSWAGYIALAITALFALHTANAETVNYVISRSDVLSTFCIVLSFLTYISFPTKRKWYLYVIPAFLGVFAKETVLVLIILLFFYILLFENKLSIADLFKPSNYKTVLNTFVKLLPVLIVVVLTQYYTLSKVHSVPGITNPLGYYILTQAYVWVHYFIAFFLPMNLSADTDWTVIQNVFDERIIIGLVFVTVLIIAIVKTSAKAQTRPIAFGLIWFAAALLPTSLAPFAEITNDHRMFFPFIGLALSVVTYIGLWLIKIEDKLVTNTNYKPIIGACILLVLGLHAYGVTQRNKIWSSDEALWLDVTQKSPLNGRGLMNYGLTQMAKGKYDIADNYYQRALPLMPYYSTLYINMAVSKGATNHSNEADEYFKKAIALAPNSYDGYAFYARWLVQANRIDEARQNAEKALQFNPYSLMVLNTLMTAYDDLGQWDNLTKTANAYLALVPGDATGQTFLDAAQKHISVATITPIVKPQSNKPLTAADHLNLSLNYYNSKQFDKCIDECKQALALKPDYADAYSNMGAAYNMLKQWDKGVEACTAALKIDPNHRLAKGNLDWAKSQLTKK